MTSGSQQPAVGAWLANLASCVLTEVPRPHADLAERLLVVESPAPGGKARGQRLGPLVSAYHAGPGPVVVCWHRASSSGPVQVHIAGGGLAPTVAVVGEPAVLTMPAGGRGVITEPGQLAQTLAGVPCWTPINVVSDPLIIDGPQAAQRLGRQAFQPSLEEHLLSAWHGPFTWFVIAEPVRGDELTAVVEAVRNEQAQIAAKAARHPDFEVRWRRLELRHQELMLAPASGLWRLRFAAGGPNPAAAQQLAGLVCGSCDTAGLPYVVTPSMQVVPLAGALATPGDPAAGVERYVSSELLAAVATPPTSEIPGVQFRLRPAFDVTAEPSPMNESQPGLVLGTVLDRNRRPAGEIVLPRSSLNRHTFVCGATGAGKSQTIRGLLETATAHGLPWLVVEPAKAEYQLMAARLAGSGHEVVTIRPGDPTLPPAGLNPLEPGIDARGNRYPLQTHLDLVRALFLAAFEAIEPFPQVLAAALTRCYEDLGWDLALGEPANPDVTPRYPTLGDLERTAMEVVNSIGYGREITDNVRGFIKVRIGSLRLGTTGRFFEGGHPIDLDRLLSTNVVLEIENVGDDRDKAFLMGTVLIRLVEHLRLSHKGHPHSTVDLRHLSVFEEAHRLLRNTAGSGAAAHAVEMFAGLLAEIRAYGEGLIIAEQIPSKLIPDVIKNTAVKIVHRLPAKDDRDAVGATMNITPAQSEYLITLPPGQAAVFTDGMDYPLLAAMPDGTAREITNNGQTDPAALITPRSSTCGEDCKTAPCTLRQIRDGQRLLGTDSLLVVWAELSVVAHLTGWVTPSPNPDSLLSRLRQMDPRTRDCALSHSVEAAVASRTRPIAHTLSPSLLAAHVIAAMRHWIVKGRLLCDLEPQWLAPAYRWVLIQDLLLQQLGKDPAVSGRHPDSDAWHQTYGRAVPGADCREQLAAVNQWVKDDMADRAAMRAIAFGEDDPAAIVAAIGASPDHPDEWTTRLEERLRNFHSCSWPGQVLDARLWSDEPIPPAEAVPPASPAEQQTAPSEESGSDES